MENNGVPRSIQQMWVKLRRYIDPNHGLLPKLLAMDVLDMEQYSRLNEIGNTYDKNDRLLEYCTTGTDELRNGFLKSLEKTSQTHVVNFILNPDHHSKDYPLNDRYTKLLCMKLPKLIELLDSEDWFLAKLASCQCITLNHQQAVKSKTSLYDRNTLLFEILTRRSIADFEKFVECLDKTMQSHVGKFLSKEGDIMRIDVQLNEMSVANKSQAEERIVERFKVLIRSSTKVPPLPLLIELLESLTTDRRLALCKEMKDKMKITHSMAAGIELILLEIRHSIRAHFFCKSLEALDELLVRDNLTVLMKYIFTCLNDRDDELDIDTITWEDSNLVKCMESLRTAPRTDSTYFWGGGVDPRELPDPSGRNAGTVHQGQSEIHNFPIELLEMIVVKSTIAIFVATKKTHQNPEKNALWTMRSVCSMWSKILTNRRYNALQLYLSFNDQRPYPKKVKCEIIRAFDQREASGVTICGGKLYMIENLSSTVTVYEANPPFTAFPAENITIPGLVPIDITSIEPTKHLYIADRRQILWQVSATNPQGYVKFETSIEVTSIFVELATRKLLVTSLSKLSIFTLDGVRSRKVVQLPSHVDAHHSVMTSTGRVYVCHTGREDNFRFHQVSEVSMSGSFLRHYGSNESSSRDQLYQPRYLALHGDRRVIVADSKNGRVLVLSADLQVLRVLLQVEHFNYTLEVGSSQHAKDGVPVGETKSVLDKRPCGLHYVQSTGRLFVLLNNGTVHISKLRREEQSFDKLWTKTAI